MYIAHHWQCLSQYSQPLLKVCIPSHCPQLWPHFLACLNCSFMVMKLITFSPVQFKNSDPMELAKHWCGWELGSLNCTPGNCLEICSEIVAMWKRFSNTYRCCVNYMWLTIANLTQITFAFHSFPLMVFWKEILGFYDRLVGNDITPIILPSGLRTGRWTS